MDKTQTKVTFFPISSFPHILEKKLPDLQDSFLLDDEVKAGWINYNPNTVTVLTCNEMFRPIYALPSIVNDAEQILKVQTEEDLKILINILSKPLVMCVTRRQDDEAMITGFDMDFMLVFKDVTDSISEKLKTGKKCCFMVDIGQTLNEVSPLDFKNNVAWINAKFCITNHSRPNPVLSLELSCVWCVLMPCCFLASIPYRMYRKLRGEDRAVDLKVKLHLESCPDSPLILFFYDRSFSAATGKVFEAWEVFYSSITAV